MKALLVSHKKLLKDKGVKVHPKQQFPKPHTQVNKIQLTFIEVLIQRGIQQVDVQGIV